MNQRSETETVPKALNNVQSLHRSDLRLCTSQPQHVFHEQTQR